MAGRARRFVKKLSIFLNILAAFIFLLASIAPFLNPAKWWLMSFLGLAFPALVMVLILFLFYWLFFKPRYALISVFALLFGWKSISVFFAFHPGNSFNEKKAAGALRIAHWNVARFTEWRRNNNKGSQTRLKMMEQIKKQNADVLCFQEFFSSTDSIYYNNLNYVMKKIGYPYYYYSWDEDGYEQWVGQIIFSKYKIIDTAKIRFPRPGMPEALVHADIVFNKDTIRIYTSHLQSYKLMKEDYDRIEKIKNRDDSLLENSRSIFSKLKHATRLRSSQADIMKKEIQTSPYPYVLTADLNDVPNSYTYFTIKDNLQDAFLEKGFGIGRTFNSLSPTLRIDYIFVSNEFTVHQFKRIARDLSDHYMLVADLLLNKPASIPADEKIK
jgi:endonuclease/exonuclease/phosphatase family metal-dependent hydrolase